MIVEALRDRRLRQANERRVGAHAKRQIRSAYVEALRSRPAELFKMVAVVAMIATVVHWVMWDPIAPFVTGAVVASFGWVLHIAISDATGLANKRIGLTAEQWTVEELNQLGRGWQSRHHVMLEYVDVDHVALGPGGIHAIDTKFRSDWNRADLKQLAASAVRGATQLERRIGEVRGTVQPVIAMWGPQISLDSNIREVAGVRFVPGSRLVEHLQGFGQLHGLDRTDKRTDALDAYVVTRDRGELREHGPIPRPIPSYFNETFGLPAAVLAPLFAFAYLLPIAPSGLWSTVVLAASFAGAFAARRRRPVGPVARIATAVATTSLGLVAMTVAAAGFTAL